MRTRRTNTPLEPALGRATVTTGRPSGNHSVARTVLAVTAGLALSVFALAARASQPPAATPAFERASKQLASGEYGTAAAGFDALIRGHGYAPGTLRNLGNAYLAQDELGPAVLALTRAHELAPRDPVIEAQLRRARERAGDPPRTTRSLERLATYLSAREWWAWGAAALGAFVASALCIARRVRFRRLALGVSLLSGAATFVAGWALTEWGARSDRAVILAAQTEGRISPFARAESAFALHAGQTVRTVSRQNGFVRVQTEEGRSAWVAGTALEPVNPAPESAAADG